MKSKYIFSISAFFLLPPILVGLISMFDDSKSQKEDPKAMVISSDPTPTTTPSESSFKVRAAIPYWDQENAVDSFRRNVSLIDYISLFWYYIDKNGDIQKYNYAVDDDSIIDFAHENNIKVSAVITNLPEVGTWDSERVENVIKNDDSIANHIKDIETLLVEKNFDGVTIDYESVGKNQEENFSEFVKKLSESLHPKGKYVEIALHPKNGASIDRKYAFQNWKTIPKYADRVYIMAFGEHYDEGDAGPIASIGWTRSILSYANKQEIPTSKLFLGLPLFGYDWTKDSDKPAKGLTFTDVQDSIQIEGIDEISWDEKSAAPYFKYGDTHEVWFENARSVAEKIKLTKEFGLAGITFWRLGGEDPEIWEVVEKYRSGD